MDSGPLLSFDLATKTGWCAGDGSSLPTLGNFAIPSTHREIGAFVAHLEDRAAAVIAEVRPTLISFEAPLVGPQASADTRRKLIGIAAGLEVVAFRLGLPIREASISEGKEALTGYGDASKQEMVDACRRYGLNPVVYVKDGEENSDEADAMGCWLATGRKLRPAAFRAFDRQFTPVFFGARPEKRKKAKAGAAKAPFQGGRFVRGWRARA